MEDFLQLQIFINLFLQQLPAFFISIMRFFSFLGDEVFYLLFMPFLYWCVDSAMGIRVGAMLLLSNGVVYSLKLAFQWPRPSWLDAKVTAYVYENTFGFPSGHSANAASVWGIFAVFTRKRWLWILVISTAFLIGLSRMALGVHFLVDVMGGWLTGFLLVLLFLRIEAPITRWFSRLVYRQQWFVALFSSILIILPAFILSWLLAKYSLPEAWVGNAGLTFDPISPTDSFSVGGTWAGFLGGFVWFRYHFGKMDSSGSVWRRAVRFVAGIIGVIALWKGLDLVFPDTFDTLGLLLRYVRYFLVGFWIGGAAPWLFRKIGF